MFEILVIKIMYLQIRKIVDAISQVKIKTCIFILQFLLYFNDNQPHIIFINHVKEIRSIAPIEKYELHISYIKKESTVFFLSLRNC